MYRHAPFVSINANSITTKDIIDILDKSLKEQRHEMEKFYPEFDERKTALLTTAAQRNSLVPVSSLPPEILGEIFSIVQGRPDYGDYDRFGSRRTDEYLLHWIAVTHVCRRWRHIAIDLATLWIDLPIDYPEWVEEMIRRSKGCGLIVRAAILDNGLSSNLFRQNYILGQCVYLSSALHMISSEQLAETLGRLPSLRTVIGKGSGVQTLLNAMRVLPQAAAPLSPSTEDTIDAIYFPHVTAMAFHGVTFVEHHQLEVQSKKNIDKALITDLRHLLVERRKQARKAEMIMRIQRSLWFGKSRMTPPFVVRPIYCCSHWIALTHVCRRWREIAINLSTLWVDMPIEHPGWIEKAIQRSKDSSLIVDVLIGPFDESESLDEQVAGQRKRFLPGATSVLMHIHRIEELYLQCSGIM
ncbi:hypothetical protein BDN70DRAFT_898576 [Pholiota conissans]|uniref:F-box domain-containing protein n=1 Tax=Pholiota conissans TaxID=109636 RepID=A0A9P6CQC5_9AGAR|nr:hypothetical protein BDN70DRAFT_898576 [Pholiota conissans]